MKVCTKCKAIKSTMEFYKDSQKKDGFSYWCKKCEARRGKNYRHKFKKQIREYCRDYWRKPENAARKRVSALRYKEQAKRECFEAYGGLICACCGESEIKFLTLDHVNNDGAKQRREVFKNKTAEGKFLHRWLKRRGYPSGYQVLCMNCNWAKGRYPACPHAVNMYSRKANP